MTQSACRLLQRIVLFGTVTCAAVVPRILQSSTFRTVALSEQQATGAAASARYSTFGDPGVNDFGHTAFFAALVGDGVDNTNNQSIWSEGNGSLHLVARSGDIVPDLPSGVSYRGFTAPLLSDAGQVTFVALLNSAGRSFSQGVISEASGVVAYRGNTLPGGVTPNSFESLVVNKLGQAAFRVFFLPNDVGVWSEGSGDLRLVASRGVEAPDTTGKTFSIPSVPLLNDVGQTAFTAGLMGTGPGVADGGLWVDTAGSLRRVARNGEQPPGLATDVTFFRFISFALNNAGRTAFHAQVRTSGIGEGIWSEGSGSLALVAGDGDHAPGLPPDVEFFSFGSPVLNNLGYSAFSAKFSESPANANQGIWMEGPPGLQLVAHSSMHAPGTPDGVVFSLFSNDDNYVLNDLNQVAFHAGVRGIGVDLTNSGGIWATDRFGVLRLIVRDGDLLEVAPDDFRAIADVSMVGGSGNSDGRASGFNDLGHLAFRARFVDGSEGILSRIWLPFRSQGRRCSCCYPWRQVGRIADSGHRTCDRSFESI